VSLEELNERYEPETARDIAHLCEFAVPYLMGGVAGVRAPGV
jgi:hypothetical protein